jgi:carboxylate-amine ligase
MSAYAFGSDFTVGIEEEILLVDPSTQRLAPVAAEVLEAMSAPADAAGHEAYAAQIELRSPPCDTAADAASVLGELRLAALDAGAALMGSGLHPAARHGEVELVPTRRYERVAAEMRGILRRTPESALHVHVGMPDARTAVRVFNALRRHMPLLLGLSANSPWWFGVDSRMASARAALVRSYPGRGIPEAIDDIEEIDARTAAVLAVAGVPEATFLWWDLRLHPVHGTIEVREMDAQSSVESVAALGALVRVLALEAADGAPAAREPSEILAWSSFRAGRDGTDAEIFDDGALRPLIDVARRTVDRVRPIAREAGEADALEEIERLVERGGGAGGQRAAFARGGLGEVLRTLVEDSARVPEHCRSRFSGGQRG